MVSGTVTKEKTDSKESPAKVVTGGEALILSLLEENVDTIFGYPGGAIMPIYDILYGYRDRLNHILVRHEQGAIHAAEGYARVLKKTGVCFATSGPGAANLITGIADAQLDSTPLVCITAQVPSCLLGTDGFQETDVIGISMPVTKWNYQVTTADEIPETIAKAFYIANSGRPGPVMVNITRDAQLETSEFRYQKCRRIRSYFPVPKVNREDIDKAVEIIDNAEKPLIVAGHGVLISGAHRELRHFAERSGIPVACTLLGLSAFPTGHPLYAGMPGMHGNYAPNIKTNECDVLIAVGMRFDDRVTGDLKTYAKQAKVIHIEIDRSEIDKNVITDVAINADAKAALHSLAGKVRQKSYPQWQNEFKECYKVEEDRVINGQVKPASGDLKMAEVIKMVSGKTRGRAIFVTDVGQHQMMAARYTDHKKPDSFVTSGGLGTMGFGLPAAIGAKTARPDREVVLFVGDGGIQMTIQEMATIKESGLNIKIVLLNNSFLGMVRQWQEMFFDKRYSATNMPSPDFLAIARGYGMSGERVKCRDELEKAVNRMLKHKDEAYILEVLVEKEDNVFPMVPAGESVSNVRFE